VLAMTVGAIVIRRSGEPVARWVEARFGHLSANFGHKLAQKVREFGQGLDTIHGPISMLWLALVSVGMWYIIALAYQEVTHSYGVAALEIQAVLWGTLGLGFGWLTERDPSSRHI